MTGTAGVGPPTLEIRTSAGPVRYYEVGQGPALVFVHGLLVNGALWRKVVPLLSDRFRCIVPDWPLGSHHVPMSSAADPRPPGLARTGAAVRGSLELATPPPVCSGRAAPFLRPPRPPRLGIRGPRLSRWRRRAPSGRSAPGTPRADRGLLHVHARGPARAARRARRGLRVQALTPTERDA